MNATLLNCGRAVGRMTVVLLLAACPLVAQSDPRPSPATVNQLMRGLLFVDSNIVFAAGNGDPADVKRDPHGSSAVSSLAGTFGGWEAVENAALALVESATLLELPRGCSNGKAAPVADPEWRKSLDDVRQIGMAAYKAAQARSQDQAFEIGEKLALACSGCHRLYRDTSLDAGRRCVKPK